jgi:hypothetical protein
MVKFEEPKLKPTQEELAKKFQSVKTRTKVSFKKEKPNNIVNVIHFHNT